MLYYRQGIPLIMAIHVQIPIIFFRFCIKRCILSGPEVYMKGKRTIYCEIAYVVGIVVLALGTALTVYGNFGISMVVAPAYILHLKLSEIWPFFSFGVAEYAVQALILALMMLLLRKARWTYLLSFVSAVLYGTILDGGGKLTALLPADSMALRIIFYPFKQINRGYVRS